MKELEIDENYWPSGEEMIAFLKVFKRMALLSTEYSVSPNSVYLDLEEGKGGKEIKWVFSIDHENKKTPLPSLRTTEWEEPPTNEQIAESFLSVFMSDVIRPLHKHLENEVVNKSN